MGVFMGETVSELQDKKSLSWTKAKFDDWLRTWICILQLKPNILIDEIFRWSLLFSYPYSPSVSSMFLFHTYPYVRLWFIYTGFTVLISVNFINDNDKYRDIN